MPSGPYCWACGVVMDWCDCDSSGHRNGENSRSEVESAACQSGGAETPHRPNPITPEIE